MWLYCNAIFLFEGHNRLYSPILNELIEMVPEPIVAPFAPRYTAAQVARTIECDGHVNERGCWDALTKEWSRVVTNAGDLVTRFGYHVPAEGGYGEPGIGLGTVPRVSPECG